MLSYHIDTVVSEYELIDIMGILIDNALEAIEPEESVSVDLDSSDNHLLFRIKNKGPHLTDALRINMFKKGYSTKHNSITNRGYGLPKLKEIVDQHNGTITVCNDNDNIDNFIIFEVEV